MGCGGSTPEYPEAPEETNPIAEEAAPVVRTGLPSDVDEDDASVVSLPMPDAVRCRQMDFSDPELVAVQGPKDTDDLRRPAARLALALDERDDEAEIPGGRQIGMTEQIALMGLRTNFLAPYEEAQ